MSKPRYNWWSFALNMIRDYPERSKAIKELRQQQITASNSGMPSSGGASRGTEGVALRQLPDKQAQREYDVVHNSLQRTGRLKEAKLRLDVVKLTMWKGYTIPGAAIVLHMSEDTVRRYRWQFVMLVGCMYGFLTEEQYKEALKKDMGR